MRDHHPQRRPDLDGLRGVAILLVWLGHAGIPGLPSAGAGVYIFFPLSGFLITGILLGRPSWRSFYARRARRLLPALCVALVAGVAVRALWWAWSGLPQLATVVFYSANIFRDQRPPDFHQTWSLAVEEQFYCVWPVIVFALLRWGGRGRVLWGVVGAGIACTAAILLTPELLAGYTFEPYRELLCGCLLACVIARVPRSALVGWVGAVTIVVVGEIDRSVHADWCGSVIAIAACLVIACPQGPGRLLSPPPLRYFGRISYGLYVWHYPIFIWLRFLPGFNASSWLEQVVAELLISWAVAVVSYEVLERRWIGAPSLLPVRERAIVLPAPAPAGSCAD